MSASIAALTNVGLCHTAIQRAKDREAHLPGMTVFYGPSGYGKTMAASFASNRQRAFHVECKSTWTRKAFLMGILKEMGIKPEKTISEMAEQVAMELMQSGRPLIIDEMDYLVDKNYVDVVRDIYEGSQGVILLIGEEQLPNKLRKWERFHGRILDFFPAQPVSKADVKELKNIYASKVDIDADLLNAVYKAANGSARRVCANLDRIREFSVSNNKKIVTLEDWGNRSFFTGEAPRRDTI
jgi:hypothetical protein